MSTVETMILILTGFQNLSGLHHFNGITFKNGSPKTPSQSPTSR
jgi:hypothetical protein